MPSLTKKVLGEVDRALQQCQVWSVQRPASRGPCGMEWNLVWEEQSQTCRGTLGLPSWQGMKQLVCTYHKPQVPQPCPGVPAPRPPSDWTSGCLRGSLGFQIPGPPLPGRAHLGPKTTPSQDPTPSLTNHPGTSLLLFVCGKGMRVGKDPWDLGAEPPLDTADMHLRPLLPPSR